MPVLLFFFGDEQVHEAARRKMRACPRCEHGSIEQALCHLLISPRRCTLLQRQSPSLGMIAAVEHERVLQLEAQYGPIFYAGQTA